MKQFLSQSSGIRLLAAVITWCIPDPTCFAQSPADALQPANRQSLATTTDEQLKTQLQPAAEPKAVPPADQLLQDAAEAMRSAGDRLQQGETGAGTRTAQQQAIAALDELIRQLEQPPPPDQNSSPPPPEGGQPPPQSPESEQPSPSGQSQPSQSRPGDSKDSQQSQADQEQERDQAEDADARTRERQRRAEAELRRKTLQTDVWGHLPEHLREELLNTYRERMLPKYEDLVRQFYDRLSEPPSRKPQR